MNQKRWFKRTITWVLTIAMVLSMVVGNSPTLDVSAAERNVVLVGNLQEALGHSSNWDPSAATTKMTSLGDGMYSFTGTLPAGSYEYKVALGSWDESYGANGGNIAINITEPTEITFWFNDTDKVVMDSLRYTPMQTDAQPRLVGSIQPAIGGGGEWSPDTATALLTDNNFDNIYTYTSIVPKGNYEFKVVLGNDWGKPAYPVNNMILNVLEPTLITFYYDNNQGQNTVSTDYNPGGSDGVVNGDKLYHNTLELMYKEPFGAVEVGTDVTLRLQAKKDDLTRGRVILKNYLTGSTKLYNMTKIGTATIAGTGEVDIWEAIIKPTEKGVHGYKFIAGDQGAQLEYGEDSTEGGIGAAAASNASFFQLTVYDQDFKTPDWIKEAVIYQIFPDRFFNGDLSNDTAKANARGLEPIEAKAWNQLPDNPRLATATGYTGDNIWSNDFYGGDITGIKAKLDYIQSLGVNTIYLNPISQAASNHKYDATDYKSLDPMFGTHEQFMEFTTELKARNMHLIVDGVFNHVGDESIYFDRYNKYPTVGAYEYWSKTYDIMNSQGKTQEEAEVIATAELIASGQVFSDEGFHKWFNISNTKVDVGLATERYSYQAWWGFDSLPEFKSMTGSEAIALGLATIENVPYASEYNNQKLVDYIFKSDDSVAKGWLKDGAAGWRLDVANEVDTKFWTEFRKDLKNPAFIAEIGYEPLILGEIWDDASKYFVGDQYDSVMNYRFERALLGFLKSGNAQSTDTALTAVKEDYPTEAYYAMMNLIGSHDTSRAIYLLGDASGVAERAQDGNDGYNHALGVSRLKLASIFQMGYVGAPTIYYGDEVGVTGSKDPDSRRTYPWGNEDQDLLNHYRTVGAVRTANTELFSKGDLTTLYASGDIYAYARKYNNQYAIIAINRGTSEQVVELNVSKSLINHITLTDALDTDYSLTSTEGKVSVTIPAMSGRMMLADSGQSLALPSGVATLTGIEGSQEVTLNWSASPDAVAYNVYQSTIKGALYEKVQTVSDITSTLTSLANGRRYHFAVTAVDVYGNESLLKELTDVIPHYNLGTINKWIGGLTTLTDSELDLSVERQVEAQLYLDGITVNGAAEGLTAQLLVKQATDQDFRIYQASYLGQLGNNNRFGSSFVPLMEGSYTYKIRFSPDMGREWFETDPQTVVYTKNAQDITPPVTELTLTQPAQESGQVNLKWQGIIDTEDGPLLYQLFRNDLVLSDEWGLEPDGDGYLHYRDYDVVNGETYRYTIRAFDRLGNYVESNEVSVMPNLVMVDVTFKVKAPAYTPLNTKITMPGNLNGWNTGSWEMSRNGAVTPDWQYTVQIQDGEEISYKYVKESSWDQEALTIHNIVNPDPEDISYYGVGTESTNMRVIVENQGGNKMIIEDTILRWIDQPVVITAPEQSTTLTTDSVTITGNAIRGGILTIQGEKDTTQQVVTIQQDMTFSHTVQLYKGSNALKITIKPSDESAATKFNGDGGAIGKNTKAFTWTVVTTGGTTKPTTPSPTPTTNPGTTTTPDISIPETGLPQGLVAKFLENGSFKIKATELAKLDTFVVDGKVKFTFDKKALTKFTGDKEVTIAFEEVSKKTEVLEKLSASAQKNLKDRPIFSFEVKVGNQGVKDFGDGKISVKIPYTLGKDEDPNAVLVYYINDKGDLIPITSTYAEGYITMMTNHFSLYAVGYNQVTYSDTIGWYNQAISYLSSRHILNGVGEGKFMPKQNITRAEVLAILGKLSGDDLTSYKTTDFTDVSNEDWFMTSVAWAKSKGIVSGTGQGKFDPRATVTRQDLAVMVDNYVSIGGTLTMSTDELTMTFLDQEAISAYAAPAVTKLQKAGLMTGKPGELFDPKGQATRGEAAVLIERLIQQAFE